MSTKIRGSRLRLPASRTSTRKPRRRSRRKLKGEHFVQHPGQCPAAPSSQDESSEDVSSAEVEPAGKSQSSIPRLGTTVTAKPILRQPSQRSAAPPSQDQGPADAAAREVGSAVQGQRPLHGLGITVIGALRLALRNAEVDLDSCTGASRTQQKPEKLQLGAMAAPSPGPREVGADRTGTEEGRVSEQVLPSSWPGVWTRPHLSQGGTLLWKNQDTPHMGAGIQGVVIRWVSLLPRSSSVSSSEKGG